MERIDEQLDRIRERWKNFEASDVKYLLSLIETQNKEIEQLRSAAIAAQKHLNGTAKLFSHRTKEAVLSRLDEALKDYWARYEQALKQE